MTVYSNVKLTDLDRQRLRDIFKQSLCPNESLHNTFGQRFTRLLDDIIFLDHTRFDSYNFKEILPQGGD